MTKFSKEDNAAWEDSEIMKELEKIINKKEDESWEEENGDHNEETQEETSKESPEEQNDEKIEEPQEKDELKEIESQLIHNLQKIATNFISKSKNKSLYIMEEFIKKIKEVK